MTKNEDVIDIENILLIDALNSMNEAFAAYDASGHLIVCNLAFRNMYGYTPLQARPGVHYRELGEIDIKQGNVAVDDENGDDYLDRKAAYRKHLEGSFDVKLLDGRWIRTTDRPMPNGGFVSVQVDITERKRAGEALRESEQRFSNFAHISSDWFWETNTELRFSYFSAPFERMTGVRPEHLIGKSCEYINSHDTNLSAFAQLLLKLETHQPFRDFLHDRVGPDGKQIYVSIDGEPTFDEHNKFIGFRGTGTDITERTYAQRALFEKDQLLAEAIESIDGGVAIYDAEDRLVLHNTTYKFYLSEVSEDIALGTTYEDIVTALEKTGFYKNSAQDPNAWISNRVNLFRAGMKVSPQKDKFGNWYQTHFYKLSGGGTLLVTLNVTDQIEVGISLADANRRLAEVLESIEGGGVLYDADDNFVMCNRNYYKARPDIQHLLVPGTKFETIIRTLVNLGHFPDISEQDREGWITARLKRHGTRSRTVVRHQNNKWQQIDEYPTSDGGSSIIFTDITARVEIEQKLHDSEERFRDYATSSSDWFWETDKQHRLTFVSEEHNALVGVDAKIYLGKTRIETMAKDPNDEYWRKHNDDLENYRPFRNFCFDEIKPNGDRVPIRINGIPVFDADGIFRGYRGTGTNITEQKNLEAQLLQSQKMEAVGQLTGGVAHDFNNLLAVMTGNLESAIDLSQTNFPLRKKIEKALSAVDKGAALTLQLLSFSRQQTLTPKIVNTNVLISDTLEFLARTLGEDINIVTKFVNADLKINIDAAIFGNALVNLALNARDAMENGGTLTIRTSTVVLDGEQLGAGDDPAYGPFAVITVSDTGTGIDPIDISRVMEPFFTTKGVGKGSGLGLSMVHGFIHQSYGYIGITSRPGEGTTIALYLPLTDEGVISEQDEPQPELSVPEKKTILLVEDDAKVRDTAASLLSSFGYFILEAEDGRSALDVLEQKSSEIDLVFTDIVMPNNLSGIELAELVSVKYKDIKILLTSGYPDKILDQESFKTLGIEILAKPYRRAQLLAAIERTSEK